ncbi:MAG: chromate reductase [Flavobacterium sp.]
MALAASNSKQSINKKLVTYAGSLIENAEVEILDINDYEMPIYSADREEENGIHNLAHAFYKKIGDADALIISYAEHNGSFTAAFKNLYDWTSRIDMKVYQGKPMVMLATSPGPGGAGNVLTSAKTSAPYFGGEVVAAISFPNFHKVFDLGAGELSDLELKSQLVDAISKLTQ